MKSEEHLYTEQEIGSSNCTGTYDEGEIGKSNSDRAYKKARMLGKSAEHLPGNLVRKDERTGGGWLGKGAMLLKRHEEADVDCSVLRTQILEGSGWNIQERTTTTNNEDYQSGESNANFTSFAFATSIGIKQFMFMNRSLTTLTKPQNQREN